MYALMTVTRDAGKERLPSSSRPPQERMTPEPMVRSRLREIAEGLVRDLPTAEETLKAEVKADREKAAKGRASQLSRAWPFSRKAKRS